jgi:hypothetical protein
MPESSIGSRDSPARQLVAQRYVDSGRGIVEQQRQLIARQKTLGHSTVTSEALLSAFQDSLARFKSDLAALQVQDSFPLRNRM